MTDALLAIDRALDQLCPCGADPRDGSAYCSDDCVPNDRGAHIGDRDQMRWRPDLGSGVDDSWTDEIAPWERRFIEDPNPDRQLLARWADASPARRRRLATSRMAYLIGLRMSSTMLDPAGLVQTTMP